MSIQADPGSFRDPAGSVFWSGKNIYRQITEFGKADYDTLMKTGLYDALVKKKLLVSHKEVKNTFGIDAYKIIQPQMMPFITYPYEWSFSQLKDAALATLAIQKIALKNGAELKDASAYNIQFVNGKPIFIDTLSFRKRESDAPWEGYKQFCQHFLAPLLLMAKVDIELERLLVPNIDGVPLEIANKLLPRSAKFKPGVFMHISMHAKSQSKHANTNSDIKAKTAKVTDTALVGIISSLESTVKSLKLKKSNTEWADYYTFTNYNEPAFNEKKKLVQAFVKQSGAKSVLDMGANNGLFSRVAGEVADFVISADIDPFAVEQNYKTVKNNNEQHILPIKYDIVNPSPAIGWNNAERRVLQDRTKAVDTVMALALVHHLAISNNVPLGKVFDYFTNLGKYLIIEFVPKGDSQVDKLFATRKDVFPDYTIEGFEAAAKPYYKLVKKSAIKGTKRTLYLFERKAK